MAKKSSQYICQSCGAVHSKWNGQCSECNEWNSIAEEIVEASIPKGLGASKTGSALPIVGLKGEQDKKPRVKTGIDEFDRVIGGGLVPGAALLIGGDPGIGKSTLLLQVVCALSKHMNCLYVSGEEAVDQVRMRADRLGLADAAVSLASATSVRNIVKTMEDRNETSLDLVVVDSIQTMYIDNIDSAPGTVTQVRTCAQELIRTAKKHNIAVLFVGHVTKEGTIAGPRVLEHIVDTVLYFEGDRGHQFRILRGVKNRFGPTDEIGVFEMGQMGLSEVTNPSELFLSQRQHNVSGSAVLAGMEGTRPVLVEVQALVAPSSFASPRRAVIGWDSNRMAMILAVLESRCGIQIGNNDVYLNIAGGLRIQEPAADMAVAAALVSSLSGESVAHDTVIFGEVGLSGEIRSVGQMDSRLKEAAKLGFKHAIMPKRRKAKGKSMRDPEGIKVTEIEHLNELTNMFTNREKRAYA